MFQSVRFSKERSFEMTVESNPPPGINIHNVLDPQSPSGPIINPPVDNVLPEIFKKGRILINRTLLRGDFQYHKFSNVTEIDEQYNLENEIIYSACGRDITDSNGVAHIELPSVWTPPIYYGELLGFPVFIATPISSTPVLLTVEFDLIDKNGQSIDEPGNQVYLFRCYVHSYELDGTSSGHIKFSWSLTARQFYFDYSGPQ
jgi:hypothetical protein